MKKSFTLLIGATFSLAVQAAGSKAPSCNINVSSSEVASLVQRYVSSGANGRSPAAAVYRVGGNGVTQVIYEKNAAVAQPIASTQKVLAAWTAHKVGNLSREGAFTDEDLFFDEQGNRAIDRDSGRTVQVGQKLTGSEWMYTTLMQSANGAAHAMARTVSGSIEAFMTRMNAEARSLAGNGQSYFQNPSGLTDSSDDYRFTDSTRRQQSTAGELAKIAGRAMKDSGFRSTLNRAGIPNASSGYLYKLGYTSAAGKTVVSTFPLKSGCSDIIAFSALGSVSADQFTKFSQLNTQLRDLIWARQN